MDTTPTMNTCEGGMTFVSSAVGVAVIAVPYAFLQSGFIIGMSLNIMIIVINICTCYVYLTCMKLTPYRVESLYELSYIAMGPFGIYIVSIILFLSIGGVMIILFSSFGDIVASLVASNVDENSILKKRYIYIAVLAVLYIPIIIKRRIAEFKLLSVIFLVAIGIFILLVGIELIKYGPDKDPSGKVPNYASPIFSLELISSLNIIISS